jgi:hypothetical protein
MRHLKLAAIVLFGALLCAIPVRNTTAVPSELPAQTETEKNEVKVWVNTNSNVYHCPGTRWYGNTKRGEYVGECAAIKAGNRPAYGKACGSDCQSALTTERPPSPSEKENTPARSVPAGNPDVRVWVNTNSGVYHCPGTRSYGNTKQGVFMTQKKAQDGGNRPAYGKVCK